MMKDKLVKTGHKKAYYSLGRFAVKASFSLAIAMVSAAPILVSLFTAQPVATEAEMQKDNVAENETVEVVSYDHAGELEAKTIEYVY